jgi:CcmD family protein
MKYRPGSRLISRAVMRWIGALSICVAMLWAGASMEKGHQQPPPKTAQEGFVPVEDLPSDDRLPAAPLLITAYAAVWVVLLLYIASLWRRLSKIEREITTLRQRIGPGAHR